MGGVQRLRRDVCWCVCVGDGGVGDLRGRVQRVRCEKVLERRKGER